MHLRENKAKRKGSKKKKIHGHISLEKSELNRAKQN